MTESITEPDGARHGKRFLIYFASVVVIAGLMAWGMLAFKSEVDDKAARHKAHQLQDRLKDTGLAEPKTKAITKMFGTDGGMVCEDPDSALGGARYKNGLSNGATGPGSRPVIGDKDLVQGEILVIETYCPDKLAKFTSTVKDMKFADTVKNHGDDKK